MPNESNNPAVLPQFQPPAGKYPVPPHVRTRRVVPRAVALVTLLAAAFMFLSGTRRLEQREQGDLSPVDQLFSNGTTQWVAASAQDPNSCTGYIESSFTVPDRTESVVDNWEENRSKFALSGAVLYRLSSLRETASFSARFEFDSMSKLDTIVGEVAMPAGRLSVRLLPESKNLEVEIGLGTVSRRWSVERPETVYLVQRRKGRYSLRLPPQVQQFLSRNETARPQFGYSLVQADASRMERCRLSVADKTGAAVDLGNYTGMQLQAGIRALETMLPEEIKAR